MYNFDIKCRPGKLNSDADALSRLPEQIININNDTVNAICNFVLATPYAECLAITPDVLDDYITKHRHQISFDWRKAQHQDRNISHWMKMTRKHLRSEKEDNI